MRSGRLNIHIYHSFSEFTTIQGCECLSLCTSWLSPAGTLILDLGYAVTFARCSFPIDFSLRFQSLLSFPCPNWTFQPKCLCYLECGLRCECARPTINATGWVLPAQIINLYGFISYQKTISPVLARLVGQLQFHEQSAVPLISARKRWLGHANTG